MIPFANFLTILLTLIIGASQAGEAEVTIISSDSEPLPRHKVRRVIRKVRFSNPLAHLDPNFHLKKQHHESRREVDIEDELASVLQQTPRKRPNEVYLLLSLTFFKSCSLHCF